MGKDFDAWNEKKKLTEKKPAIVGINRREIWWVTFGINLGVETDGKNPNYERPALVIQKFNKDMVWILPITSKEKFDEFHLGFIFKDRDLFIKLTQIRTVSTKRFLRKIGMMRQEDFAVAIKKLKKFL